MEDDWQALVISGGGRYADDWHPFAQTSAAIADIARGIGIEVEVRDDVERALADLGTMDADHLPDLVIFDLGKPTDGDASPGTHAATHGLEHLLASDRPILALHASVNSMPELPAWERSLGGRWLDDESGHPDFGDAEVLVPESDHPILTGLTDFTVLDERYTGLRMASSVDVLAYHLVDDVSHPLAWVSAGRRARTICDVLGHDTRSYESPARRQFLVNELNWLLA